MRLNMGEWILTSSILILIVLLIRRVFKNRLTAKIRYSIWFLVLLRLILPFSFFESSFSLLNLLSEQETQEQIMQGSLENQLVTQEIIPQSSPTLPQAANPQSDMNHSYIPPQNDESTISDTLSYQKILFIIWGIGIAATLFIIAGSNSYFAKKVKISRKMTENLQNKESLPVYLSENVPVPCMFGIIKPAVYVRSRDAEDKITLSYILKHENTHYRHRDNIWAFFRSLCLILHWYNPLVWIAAYCSKQDAELFCDESVIRPFSAEEAEEYGKVLISLSLKNTDYLTVLNCATTLSGGKNYLKERVSRIARRPGLFIFSTTAVIVLCIAALIFTFTGSLTEAKENNTEDSDNKSIVISETLADEPADESRDIILRITEDELFINDYLIDMNGDGIADILRLTSIDDAALDSSLPESEALRKAVEENKAGYYQIALYDGANAADMQKFRVGDELNEDALITTFEAGLAHAGNTQYSYFEENKRGYLIWNSPYFGQDTGGYSYEIITYTNDWEQETVADNFLGFSAIPYSPEMTWMSPYEYISENFPIEDMVDYTMELKEYLDKAVIIVDTSVFGRVLFTTCFENISIKPNAFAIWHWDNIFSSVNSEETLREALSDMYNTILYAENGIVPNPELENVTYWWDMPPVTRDMTYSEYMRNQPELLEKVPENALTMTYNIVEYAIQDVEAKFKLEQEARQNPWVDWKITYLNFYGTYRMGEHTLDVYRYNYYCKLDENIDINNLGEGTFWAGGMMDRGDNWYQFDYGNCVVYDRESDICFHAGSNDSYPGDTVFTNDLLYIMQLNGYTF